MFNDTNIQNLNFSNCWRFEDEPANANINVCHWTGIRCDQSGNVIKITLQNSGFYGFINFRFIPKTIRELNFRNTNLKMFNFTALSLHATNLQI